MKSNSSTSPVPSPTESVKALPVVPDTLLIGDYRRNIGIDSDTRLTFEAGEYVALRTTVGEVIEAVSSHTAKIQALIEATKMALNFENERRAGIKHEPADYGELHETLRAALSLPSA